MGCKYEVQAWTRVFQGYGYVQIYAGNSLRKAILIMYRAKKWSSCVKFGMEVTMWYVPHNYVLERMKRWMDRTLR